MIVIEGTDGSGKGTQVAKIIEKMKNLNLLFEVADFPQYGKPSAFFVEKYLRGEYGTAEEVGPYQGSLPYAMDRFDKSFEMRQWLADGKTVVCNRYVSSSMGHQGAKIADPIERDRYLEWLDHLEFDICKIPRPDLIIFLFVPPEVGQKLVDQKAAREYTQGKKRDIHEADLDHLKKASETYKYIANKFGWQIIDSAPQGELLSIDEIHELVWKKVEQALQK